MKYNPKQVTTTIRRHTKLECEHNTRKERETYLLCVRNLDMEMTTDTLETDTVNEMFVSVTVDPSFTTKQEISSA